MDSQRPRARLSGIYGIVDAGSVADPLAFAAALLRAGVRVLQYRAKGGVDAALLKDLLRRAHAVRGLVIVNDDFEAALGADGWHVGQDDLEGVDVAERRAALGERLLGVSCGSPTLARAAEACGADYIGAGPFAVSPTKRDARTPLGSAGLREIVAAVHIPVVAIGGIGLHNVAAVAGTGAAMAAVISSVAAATDPRAAATALVRRWEAGVP